MMVGHDYSGTASRSAGPELVPFQLIDHHGTTVTHETFLNQYLLVFFGFTHCRVVCPRALARMAEVLEKLGPDSKNIQAIYVTVDAARDKPEVMKTYLQQYPADILGITGDEAKLERVKKGFRVFSQRIEDSDDPDGYSTPHTALTYLMSPGGRYLRHFPDTIESDEMAGALKQILS